MKSASPARSAIRRTLFRSAAVIGLVLVAAAIPPLLGLRAENRRMHVTSFEAFVILACLGLMTAGALAASRAIFQLLASRFIPSRRLPRSQRNVAIVFVLLGAGLLVGLSYARYVEPLRLTIRRHQVALPGLVEPLRMVVFSDLHSDPRFPVEDGVVEAISRERPDLIVFLGDALNLGSRAAHFRQTLARLHAPVMLAIRGNWDVWYWDDIDLYAGTGFLEIESGWRQLDLNGVPLRVGGHAFVDDWTPDQVLPAPPPGPGPTLFFYHATDYAHVAARQGVDLYLDGDTHGGQIALPFYGPLLSIGRRGRELSRGRYHVGQTVVVVTSGIGVEPSFPFRFAVLPEIVVVDLVPQ